MARKPTLASWSAQRDPQNPPLSGCPCNGFTRRTAGVLYPLFCHSRGQASGGRAIHVSGAF
eukprot:6428859-Lingulodinium_polyedra.AAC.1